MRFIYCAGEEGRVVLDSLRRANDVEDVAFLDDDESQWGTSVDGRPVVGGAGKLETADPHEDTCIVAFGAEPSVRLSLASTVETHGISLFSAVDPTSTIASTADIGEGVIVNSQTYVGPDVVLEDLVLVDSAVNVSHDVHLREGVTVAPNATLTGGVTVDRDAYIGAGSTIRDHVHVGRGAFIGAGAVVIDDVPPGQTVVGVPAEPIER